MRLLLHGVHGWRLPCLTLLLPKRECLPPPKCVVQPRFRLDLQSRSSGGGTLGAHRVIDD